MSKVITIPGDNNNRTPQEGKELLGELFVYRFGKEFVSKNINKLGTLQSQRGDDLFLKFCMAMREPKNDGVLRIGGTPDKLLMYASINLKNGEINVYAECHELDY